MAKKFMKGAHQILKTNRTPKAAHADVQLGFGDKLEAYLFVDVRKNAEKIELIHSMKIE